jgi:hypothetical protein
MLLALQGFRTPEEVATFGSLMQGLADIVVGKYDGSLKVCVLRWNAARVQDRHVLTEFLLCWVGVCWVGGESGGARATGAVGSQSARQQKHSRMTRCDRCF